MLTKTVLIQQVSLLGLHLLLAQATTTPSPATTTTNQMLRGAPVTTAAAATDNNNASEESVSSDVTTSSTSARPQNQPAGRIPDLASLSANCLGDCTPSIHNNNNDEENNNCYDLTQDVKGQQGALWFEAPMNVTNFFHLQATIYVGDKDGGADGLAFVIQPYNNSVENGGGGGGMGYMSIQDAFAVEVDTYKDGNYDEFDHVEVAHTSPLWQSIYRSQLYEMENDEERVLNIVWLGDNQEDSNGDNFFVWMYNREHGIPEFSLRTSVGSSISDYIGGATTAYFGFTAATGARHNLHYVCPIAISDTRNELDFQYH